MKQFHQDIDQKSFEKGINSDVNPEILGTENGVHLDAVNMRSLSMDGHNFAKKKIKGEELLYRGIDNRCYGGTGLPISSTYHCMATFAIHKNIIEIWADKNATDSPFFRVNGKIVLQSEKLPIYYTHPIQIDKNENCVGGEFYVTNNLTPPMVFSLKDIMINGGLDYGIFSGQCSSKYFDDFNLEEYTVNVTSALYKPAFIRSISGTIAGGFYDKVFGSNGLPVGSYSYSYRYVTTDGDRGSWSPISELIPVISSIGTNSNQSTFPNNRTYSKKPDITVPSSFGNYIRIRYYNENNFEFIEVRRDSWYGGDALGNPPVSEIIGVIEIKPGVDYLDVLDKADPTEIEEVITIEEQVNQSTSIERAKAIRYYNERLYLMNVGYASKVIDDKIDIIDPDSPAFPTIQKLGKPGHKSTYNATYYKSDMRGEKVSTAIILYDESCNPSYAKKIEDNFQFPNRRELCSAETKSNSYLGMVSAASVDNTLGLTHEVFDHEDAIGKDGNVRANILDRGSRSYEPFRPTSSTQSDGTELGQRINTYVGSGEINGTQISYNPKIFGLNYYAMGYSFKGIDTSTNPIPTWASGFSVVKSEPAKRVIAQGMGYYRLENTYKNFGPNGGKSTDEFFVYFPDLEENFGLNPQAIDNLLSDFSAYQIQLVSPLGFATELYSFLNNVGNDDGVDMITYNRVLRDAGQINPTSTSANTGISGYTGYGKWRNPTNGSPFVTQSGNKYFNIVNVSEEMVQTGAQSYLRIRLSEPIYAQWGGNGETAEDKTSVKEWQEPMYVVNLVRKDAAVPDLNTTQYKYGGNFIKFNSLIYQVQQNGESNFTVPLVSERWEDCCTNLANHSWNSYQNLKRFVYVKDGVGNERRWMNVTYESSATINQILTDIQNNGFYVATDSSGSYNVYGVYKHTETTAAQNTIVTLEFNWFNQSFSQSFMVPTGNSRITVKYDNRIPVRVFSGDTYINECIWAVKDVRYNKDGKVSDESQEFRLEMAFPYGEFHISPDVQILNNPAFVANWIQNMNNCRFRRGNKGASIRQLISMWTAETRVNLSFAFNDDSSLHSYNKFYPLKNYIQRPYKWKDDEFNNGGAAVYNDNHIFEQYGTDYGDEFLNWGLGGFRFKPQMNIDYSKSQTTLLLTSVPDVGFEEQNEFCTRIIWSEKRPINAQNTPTVRTFPPGNYFDISDDTGEIKKAFSAITNDKGNNLYAFTEKGVCLVLVDKRIIHEINSNELATVGSDIGGVLGQLWLNTEIGMNNETWRSSAEFSNMLFFTNEYSSWMFSENNLVDLGVTGYKNRLRDEFIPKIGTGYSTHLTGGYNPLNQEYIVGFRPTFDSRIRPENTLIFGVQQNFFQCRSSYDYDQYLYIANDLYGMKRGETYKLGYGNQINGVDIEASLSGVSDKQILFDKEFLRIRVNSNVKPEKIEFYDSQEQLISGIPSSVVDAVAVPLSIKDYFGYECFVPRKDLPPHYRQQGRVLIFKIINSSNEDFLITSVGVQYKTLK